jgi:hypothetical protein
MPPARSYNLDSADFAHDINNYEGELHDQEHRPVASGAQPDSGGRHGGG